MIGEYQMLNDEGTRAIAVGFSNGLCKHNKIKLYEEPNALRVGVCVSCAAVVCSAEIPNDYGLLNVLPQTGRAGYRDE